MSKRVFLALALGGLMCGCSAGQTEPEEENIMSVDVAPVLASPIQLKVEGDAVLYPLQQAAIVPKISSPILKFYVERGASVRRGQLLAELENKDLTSLLAEAKAAYDQAQATFETTSGTTVPEDFQKAELDLKAAKDTLDAQQKVYDSRQALYKEGAIAQKELNDSQVALTQARNQFEIAQVHMRTLQNIGRDQALKAAAAQRDAAKARYETALAQLSYAKITSPIDGVVTDRPNYAGETAQSGVPLITVMDLSQVIARVHVSQQEAAELRIGNAASLMATDGTAPVPGTVTVISPALDPASTTVEVWVQAKNPAMILKAGSSLRVQIIAKTVEAALVIPEQAVLTSPAGSTSVITIDSENKPDKKGVTLGIHDGGNVEVIDGLESGERVVTAGAFELDKLDEDVLAKTTLQIQAPPEEEEEEDK